VSLASAASTARSAPHGSGLLFGVRGIVGKEVRSRTRGWRPMILLTTYLLLLATGVVAMLAIGVSSTGTISPQLGQLLFSTLAAGSVLLVAFISPALTAGAVSGERERMTLDLMLVTRASALGLMAGKLLGALLWILYLLVASLPALGIVYLFGGVPPMTVLAALVVTISTAVCYTSLGLACSALFRRTAVATVLAYGLVLLTMVLLPILAVVFGLESIASTGIPSRSALSVAPFGWPPAYVWLTFASPAIALVSVLGGQLSQTSAGVGTVVGPLSVYAVRSAATGGISNVETVTSLAAWVFNALMSFGFAVLALLLAARWVNPRRRSRVRRVGS
jgi:ABC-type transport system involved in multi-copper enzyme maturation permease subunit